MRKIIGVMAVFALTLTLSVPVFAQDTSSQKQVATESISKVGSQNVSVSGVMSYSQMLNSIAKDNNITTKEVSKSLQQNNSFLDSNMLEANATYRSIGVSFAVNGSYQPTLRFYCQTSESSTMWGIVKIVNINMDRSYNGMSKQFKGTVYANLQDAGTIFWTVNGDFYNNGTTTVSGSGGASIDVGGAGSVDFSASSSYASNHYAYCYKEGYFRH